MSIYPCDLLPNSQMGQEEYREKFSIRSTKVPFKLIHSNNSKDNNEIVEYSEYITSNYSMSSQEWVKSLIFSYYIQGLHNLGLLRSVAIYCCNEFKITYSEFYNMLLDYSRKRENTLLNCVFTKVETLCRGVAKSENEFVTVCDGTGDILWGFDELLYLEFYKQLEIFYSEIKSFVVSSFGDKEEIDELFEYQKSSVKKIGIEKIVIESGYDFYSYFNAVFSNSYVPLEKKKTVLKISDSLPVYSFVDFAREVVWYGRNKRASDYTSTNYNVEYICG